MSGSEDFSTSAALSIEIPSRELRNVRQQIESELGSVEIGATDGGSMSAQSARRGGAGSSRERRRRRREFRWNRDNHDNIETIVSLLRSVEEKVGGGGGGGGILNSIIGVGGEAVGGAAGGVSSGVSSGVGSAVGSAVGTAVGGAISNNSVSVDTPGALDVEDLEPIDVTEPEWAPFSVENPDWVPLEADEPEWAPLAVEDPSPLGVNDPSPLAVEQPTLQVEDVDPIPVEGPGTSITIGTSGGGGGGDLSGIPDVYEPPGILEATREGAATGGDMLPVAGHLAGGLVGFGRGIGAQIPGNAAQDRARRTRRERRTALLERAAKGGGGAGEVSVQVDQNNDVSVGGITIDADVSYDNLDRELSQLEQDILNEVDARIEDAMDDLERRLRRR
jgi:hypothetical protein